MFRPDPAERVSRTGLHPSLLPPWSLTVGLKVIVSALGDDSTQLPEGDFGCQLTGGLGLLTGAILATSARRQTPLLPLGGFIYSLFKFAITFNSCSPGFGILFI